MSDLFAFSFSSADDVARASSWSLAFDQKVFAGAGHDLITGLYELISGTFLSQETFSGCTLVNHGAISTGDGRDQILLAGSRYTYFDDRDYMRFEDAFSYPLFVNHVLVDLGTGDDQIEALNSGSGGGGASFGGINKGRLLAGLGNDFLSFEGYVGLRNKGVILMGEGDDRLNANGMTNVSTFDQLPLGFAEGKVGIHNDGWIDFGHGTNSLHSSGVQFGLLNSGRLNFGQGDDYIYALGQVQGLRNLGEISLGQGSDRVLLESRSFQDPYGESYDVGPALVNSGLIDAGSGDDILECSSASGPSLVNFGRMSMGPGADQIRNVSHPPYESIFSPQGARPIRNLGLILMGSGDDLVDSLISPGSPGGSPDPGFVGRGLIDMGSGNDTFRGYGDGQFHGGVGLDTLILPIGTYAITPLPGERYRLGARMTVSGFERFGEGADRVSFAAAVVAGSVTFS